MSVKIINENIPASAKQRIMLNRLRKKYSMVALPEYIDMSSDEATIAMHKLLTLRKNLASTSCQDQIS